MFGRTFLLIIVLIALSGISLVAFAISDNTNTSKQINQQQINQQPVSNSNLSNVSKSSLNAVKGTKLLIGENLLTPSTAKLLAKKYIKQQGAIPGTPKLTKEDGKKIYVVPVILNKSRVGEIDIDAHTGKNLGGAGGAPNN
jgi:uncharacterized membrane protein YkoI